jgi:hypothetical protein
LELGGIAPSEEASAVLWKVSNVAEMQSGGDEWCPEAALERRIRYSPYSESVRVLKK